MGCREDSIPKPTRRALHRCRPRHGISRLPQGEEARSKRKPFNETRSGHVPIGSAQLHSAQLRSAEGVTHRVLAIDRVSRFASVEFPDSPGKREGAAFLRGAVQAFPSRIRRVLPDNGVASTQTASTQWDTMRHLFDRVRDEHGIEHRPTQPYPPGPTARPNARTA